ncbi:MAG: tRNA (cytidine(34)-2'-O)-methyltransferase [Solobacterium sp.]|nr:tRNA (cytidine(34)-2'-O)-methyltransferase [Solobacterium sp.]
MIHVVLYEPEIPQNTGNIMRTCVAFGCRLDLIEPLGFYVDQAHLKRASLDYIDRLDMRVWHDWNSFVRENKGEFYYTTRYGHKNPSEFDFSSVSDDIYLVFGKESTGIDKDILKHDIDRCIRIPMVSSARCLNVSNTVAVMIYEVMRQKGFPGLSADEAIKGADFLERL